MFSLFKPSLDKLQALVRADDDDALYDQAQKHEGILGLKDENGFTLLMMAFKEKQYRAAEAIIMSGVDTNATHSVNQAEMSAFDYAVHEEDTPRNIFGLLLESGTKMVTKYHFLPVSYPLMREDLRLAKLFIDNGARMNGLLVIALEEQVFREAAFLIENGADVNERDAEGRTPLMLAIECHKYVLVELLIKAGADATAKDRAGKTTLHYTKGKSKRITELVFKSSLAAQ